MSAIKPKCRKPPIFIALSLLFLVVVIAISSSSSFSFFSFGQQTGTGTAKAVADNPAVSSASQQQQQFLAPAAQNGAGNPVVGDPVMGDPWLNGFPYRKPISISGSGSPLTDFQVNVTPYIYNETGLVGSWHFSESGGRTTADSSGQWNTSTFVNGANITTDGKFGNAAKFDGTNDYVDLGTPASLQLTTMTIAGWVRATSGTFAVSEALLQSAASGYGVYFTNRNVRFGKNGVSEVASGITITDTNWHYLVVTYDGSTAKFYDNGVLDSSPAYANPSFASTQKAIGSSPTGSATFNGTIDEVKIYNRTLSISEIQQQYQAKARLDYADIRFTSSDGATLLPFWMEQDGKFWVKVPSIPTTGTTIYAYYGNLQANDAQNGTGTFELFDDFNRADSSTVGNGWTVVGTNINSISGNRLRIDGTATAAPSLYKAYSTTGDVILEAKFTRTALSTLDMYLYLTGTTKTWIFGMGGPYGSNNIYYVDAGWVDSGVGTVANKFYNLKIVYHSATQTGDYYTGANSYLGTGGGAIGTSPLNSVMFGDWDTGSEFGYYDDVRVRKYASPEPSAVNGTEQSLNATMMVGSATNWTWKVPTVGEKVRTGGAQDWNWKPFQQYLGRYRKPISISGSGTTLTDFQVNVTPYIYNETGLVGSWHFSESGGRTTADSSGYGNTGLITGGSNQTLDGKFGNAMKFDGTDDKVLVGTAGMPNGANPSMTVIGWVYPKGTNAQGSLSMFSFEDNSETTSKHMSINLRDDIRVINIGHYANDWTTGVGFKYNEWRFIAYTYNGTAETVYNGTYSETTTRSFTIDANEKIQIGYWSATGTGNYWFNGTIDEVRIYNRTLSASEIQQHYQAKARLDYADVRFTDSDGSTLLPFWMESDGKFWVKVPSIPTTGTTIYAYYGNPQANDAQNGTGTFEFFDDFSGSSLDSNKWITDGTAGNSYTVSNGILTVVRTSGSSWAWVQGKTFLAAPMAMNMKFKWDSEGDYAQVGLSSGILGSDHRIDITTSGGSLYHTFDGTQTSATRTVTYLNWKVLGLAYRNTASALFYNDGVFGTEITTHVPTQSLTPLISVGYMSTNAYADWVFTRKYASPEPSAVNGTEEDSPIPQNITVPLGGATNWTWYPS